VDTAAEDQRVEARSNVLLKLALQHGSNFWASPERTRQIVSVRVKFATFSTSAQGHWL
jgi:hypothetical protein